ncbi:MAG: NAD(+)/NADH kinase, partial [Gammaproteobacteria bacterium]|nr:NAD(+)/NADH kinase [Gammaproteobacteria bacterium]
MYEFKKVGLIVKFNDAGVSGTLNEVYNKLKSKGVDLLLDHTTRGLLGGPVTVDIETIGKECDLAIIIGGDGTLLHAARELVDFGVPLVGINRGRLGFLVDVCPEKGLPLIDEILEGKYIAEQRFMFEASILRDDELVHQSYAFNDVVLRIRDLLQIMEFEVYIDDSFVNCQRADGIIVSTPSGSTAYSLSNGGPIVNPTLDAVVLQPICPHTLSSRSLVVSSDCEIKIHICDKGVPSAQAVCDGQVYMDAQLGDVVRVRRKEKSVRLLHPLNYD